MKRGQFGSKLSPVRMTHSVILFWVGSHRMGIEAGALKEVSTDDGRSAAELGCEAILSAHDLFNVRHSQGKRLLVLRPGRVAVRVDRVDRMIEISALRPLPRAFQGPERNWYRGFAFDREVVFPVLNPDQLEREALASRGEFHHSAGDAPSEEREVGTL